MRALFWILRAVAVLALPLVGSSATNMSWGPHCDYSGGSIDLFQTKPQNEELERVLGLMEAGKQPPLPAQGLGQRSSTLTTSTGVVDCSLSMPDRGS